MAVTIKNYDGSLFKTNQPVPEVKWAGIGTGFVKGCVVKDAVLLYTVNNVLTLRYARDAPIDFTEVTPPTVPKTYKFSALLEFKYHSPRVVSPDVDNKTDLISPEPRPEEIFVGAYVTVTITNDGVDQKNIPVLTEPVPPDKGRF